MHAYMHMYGSPHACTNTQTYMHTYIRTHTLTNQNVYRPARISTWNQTCRYIHTFINTNKNTTASPCTHTYVCVHIPAIFTPQVRRYTLTYERKCIHVQVHETPMQQHINARYSTINVRMHPNDMGQYSIYQL